MREIVAALLQHLLQRLGEHVGDDVDIVGLVASGVVARHEFAPFLDAGVVGHGGIVRVLHPVAGDDALRIVEARGLEHAADVRSDGGDELHRLPFQFGDLANGLRRKFRRREIHHDVRAGRLDLDDLRVDRRRARVVGDFRDDHAGGLVAETVG